MLSSQKGKKICIKLLLTRDRSFPSTMTIMCTSIVTRSVSFSVDADSGRPSIMASDAVGEDPAVCQDIGITPGSC